MGLLIFRTWYSYQIIQVFPAVGVGARVYDLPRVPKQPPNENRARYSEDHHGAEASPNPPLSDEETKLLLEKRENRHTEYPTHVHHSASPSNEVKGHNTVSVIQFYFFCLNG